MWAYLDIACTTKRHRWLKWLFGFLLTCTAISMATHTPVAALWCGCTSTLHGGREWFPGQQKSDAVYQARSLARQWLSCQRPRSTAVRYFPGKRHFGKLLTDSHVMWNRRENVICSVPEQSKVPLKRITLLMTPSIIMCGSVDILQIGLLLNSTGKKKKSKHLLINSRSFPSTIL